MPTAPTTPPTVTALPDAPQRTQPPAEFVTKADAHVAALTPMVTEENALAAWQNTTAQEVYDNAVEANTSASNASTSEGNASTSATLAEDWANEAEDVPVSGGEFSSKHYSLKSEAFKDSAETAAAAAGAAAGLPSLVGNARKVLKVGVSETTVEWGAGVFDGYDEFTTSGTWNKDDNATYVYIECIGGGSGGSNNTTASAGQAGSGGEGVNRIMLASAVGSSETVVVGSGGAGGADTVPDNGGAGGDSSFGSHITAFGGNVSFYANTSSPPGFKRIGTSSSIHTARFLSESSGLGGYSGDDGSPSIYGGGGGGGGANGSGGMSELAGDGGDGNSTASTSAGIGGSPGGGGGASSNDGGGGDGGDGIVRVWQW